MKFIARISFAAFLLLTLIAGVVHADEKAKPAAPAVIKGGKVISVKEAKELLDKKNVKFFDMRSPVNFGKGHIPGAKALPYKENSSYAADFDVAVDKFDLGQLPTDKNSQMVFYSDGPTGWKSYKAAVLAIKGGYKKVMWLRDGFSGWQSANLPVE